MIKDDRLRDNPVNPEWREGDDPYARLIPEFTTDRPEVQDVIRGFREAVGPDRLLLGELYLPLERLVAYYASGLDMPANFHLLTTPWTPRDIAALVEAYEAALPAGAWPNWVLGNHDRPRLASRLPPGSERAAAYLLLTLRGTPTLYYGDEIGMRDVADRARAARRPVGVRQPRPRAHADAMGRARRPSPPAFPGSRSRTTTSASTSPPSATTPARCSRSTAAC